MALQCNSEVFDCPRKNDDDPCGRVLKMTAKRYFTSASSSNDEGLTLLFAHCVGAHKEQWEPIIESIFGRPQPKARHQRVREAWAFDWQNHGDAAILNRELLSSSRKNGVSAGAWAEAIAAFLRSPRMHGRRVIGIGHSAGSSAVMLSMKDFCIPDIPYVSIILIEPTLATREMHKRYMAGSFSKVVDAILTRRERWASRDEAYQWLKQRAGWRVWDARVLRIFTEHGLEALPGGEVALKCDRRQEAIAYPDPESHFQALDELARVSRVVPVHLVWTTRSHTVPVQNALADESAGRVLASVTRLEGGHLIVQEDPHRVALAICNIIDTISVDAGPRYKL